MAFIQLQRAADNPNQAFLVNTDHLVSVELKPYNGGNKFTHQIDVKTSDQGLLSGYFSDLQAAQTAYGALKNNLAADAPTIIFY